MLDGHKQAEHSCRNFPEQCVIADRLGCDLQCGGAAAIAEKSTGCALAMAAKMGAPQSASVSG
jgi:hypothetical protein